MLKLVLKHINPYGLPFVLGSAAKLAEAMLELYLPILMANIIDNGIISSDRNYILKNGGMIVLTAFFGVLLALFCQYCAAVSSQGTGTNIRNALAGKISGFSYAELDKFDSAALVNRITSDVNYVQQAVAFTARLVTRAPFICIGAVVMSLGIDVKLTLIFIAVIPVLGLILYLFMKATARPYSQAREKLDRTASIAKENLSGVRVIRAFARSERERKRFERSAADLRESNIRAANIASLTNPVSSIVVNLAVIAILYLGACEVFAGDLTRGNILALSVYASKILYSLLVVANLTVMFTKAAASAERINEVMNTEASVVFQLQTLDSDISDGENAFEFENVSFAYNKKENALSNINLKIKKGSFLGIIGVTGSGKTTLFNLLQRFYDVSSGTLKIDGISIKSFSEADLRKKIGVVPQKTVLFSGTVADNIKLGEQSASEEQILRALETAQALDFVLAMPEGIDTLIEEGGKNLSGGQKQRLAIARALVKQPPILILDDSLSALDYRTDLLLRKSLKTYLLKSSTVVMSSQRVSSIKNADAILVLDEGNIVGFGKHEYLLENCAEYREIYDSQFQDESEDGQ